MCVLAPLMALKGKVRLYDLVGDVLPALYYGLCGGLTLDGHEDFQSPLPREHPSS